MAVFYILLLPAGDNMAQYRVVRPLSLHPLFPKQANIDVEELAMLSLLANHIAVESNRCEN